MAYSRVKCPESSYDQSDVVYLGLIRAGSTSAAIVRYAASAISRLRASDKGGEATHRQIQPECRSILTSEKVQLTRAIVSRLLQLAVDALAAPSWVAAIYLVRQAY